MVVSEEQFDAPRPQGQWALAWRRFKRDRVAVGCGIFLLLVVFLVGPGAAMDAGMAIGIAMYIETVFGLPGLGRTMIRALAGLQGYDLPMILAVTMVTAAAIIVLNLIADLVLLAIDPTVTRRDRGMQKLLGRAG